MSIHVQLIDDLRHKIVTEEQKPHNILPGELELTEALNISRATLKHAW
jgi:DNA-binding GntR family transcriptional regulator